MASETFTVAFDRRDRFDLARPDAAPWLLGIATNLLRHHRRSEGRRLRALARLPPEPGVEEPVALRAWLLRIETREAFRVVRRLRRVVRLDGRVAELASPGSDLAARVDMRQALMTLPARTRAAVALHHLAGLSVRETADALGVTENTIKSQLKSGLARLREVLDDG